MFPRMLVKPPVYRTGAAIDDEAVGQIQGQDPDSVEEWRVAQSLSRFRIPFDFKFEIFDSSVRGGIVLDFLVKTRPLSTPLEVYGQYWHKGERSSKERIRDVIIEDYFRGNSLPLLIFFASDLQTQEMADAKVRRELLA